MIRPDKPGAPKGLPVEDAATLRSFFLRGGSKSGDDIRKLAEDMEKEGASLKEIYDETGKYVHPENETGLRKGVAGDWLFDIPDNRMNMTPLAQSYLSKPGGDTGVVDLQRLMKHDLLYDYVPGAREVPTLLETKSPGDNPSAAYSTRDAKEPKGFIRTTANPGDVNDANDPFSQRQLLAHEINHFLQETQNLPQGAHSHGAGTPGMQGFFNKQMVPQAEKMRDRLRAEQAGWFTKEGLDPKAPESKARWERFFPDQKDALEAAMAVGGSGMVPGQTRQWPDMSTFQQYESTAGEQAARNSQDTSTMSAEELRADSPYFQQAGKRPKGGKPLFMPPALQPIVRYGGANPQWELPDLDYWMKNLDVKR